MKFILITLLIGIISADITDFIKDSQFNKTELSCKK
jgi:hypothetical protein